MPVGARREPRGLAPALRSRRCPKPSPTAGPSRRCSASRTPRSRTCREDDLLRELLLADHRDPRHADTAAILLLDEDGDVLRARAAKGIEEEVEQGVRIPVGKGFAGRIAAERRAIVIDDVDHADILNPILREKGIRSLLGVPLVVEGARARRAARRQPHARASSPTTDRDLLQLAADRAALAIEHAALYERERAARSAAEAAPAARGAAAGHRRGARLPAAEDELLAELLDRITDDPAAPTRPRSCCSTRSGDVLRARAAKGIEEEVEQGVRIPVGKGFAGRIAAERRAIAIEDVDHADILNPILREKGIRSLLGVPLLVEGRVHRRAARRHAHPAPVHAPTSATCCSSPPTAPRSRSSTRRLFEQRRLAEALQRRLLPQRRSSASPGSRSPAATCRPCGETLGGDWYDAFPLDRRPGRAGRRRRGRPRHRGRRGDGAAAHRAARLRRRRPPAGGGRRAGEPPDVGARPAAR